MNKIKFIIEEKGITHTWLSKKLGKSFNMINSYVQNRSQPNIETLYQIAEILDVEINELLYSKDEVKKIKKQFST